MRAPSGTLPSLVKPSSQTQRSAPRGGPRTMVFAQSNVNYMCFNDFNIFFFSINTFHNHHPSLNACVSNFIFSVVLSRYLAFNAPSKVVISLGTSFKSMIFAHSAAMAVWNSLLELFLIVWRPQMRPERQPQGGSTNHEYHLSSFFIPIQSQFGLCDSFLTRFQAFFR